MAKDRSEKEPKSSESKIKKVEFLKVVASNPDKKAVQIGQDDFAMSQSAVFNTINEFVLNCIWSDEDKDYPNRVLTFYNKDIPDDEEKLNPTDIEQLRHFVDDYYQHHLPGGDLRGKSSVHVDNVYVPNEVREETRIPQQESYNNPQSHSRDRAMSGQPNQAFNQERYQQTDLSQDAGYLRTLLLQGKYVHPTIIERFIRQYDMNKEVFDRDPIALLDVMKHMFTNQQGEILWKLFQKGRGKFVYGADGSLTPTSQAQQDPMLMMLMMQMMGGGGGNFNPAMMPMLQQMMGGQNDMMGGGIGGGGGGGMNMQQMMMMMMISQMGNKSAKDQQKQDMNELFEKMIQAVMLKMVGGAAEDKKPWDIYGMYGGGGMNPMMGGMMMPQIQEVLDQRTGQVTQRNIVPHFGGMGQPNQPDPVLMTVLNNTMNTNTQLLMKITEAGKTPTDILLGMIPYFKDSGNSALQLSNMFKTMNEIMPGFFQNKAQDGQNVEIAKLKLDTDLALQAQRMELSKMEHTWRIDEMDRKANNDNAQNWMRMIESLGGSFTDKVAPALLEGLGKGGLMGGGKQQQQQQQQQMDPMQQQMRMQNMRMRQMQEAEREQRMAQAQQDKQKYQQEQVQQMQDQATMNQQQALLAIGQLQGAVQQRDQQIAYLSKMIQDIQNQPTQRYQGGPPLPQQVSEQQLLRLQTGELQQMLRELNNSSSQESSLKGRIETILANRAIMDQQVVPQEVTNEPQQMTDEPGTEIEDISSQETKELEEHSSE